MTRTVNSRHEQQYLKPQKRRERTEHFYLDLVESGGGMWKISSLPTINYCLSSGARFRHLAGVSGGGLLVGLLGAGATSSDLFAALPHINNFGFLDAFNIPVRLREIFSHLLMVKNGAGRLPKWRDRRLGEVATDLSIVCAKLDLSGSILKNLSHISRCFSSLTLSSLLKATADLTDLLHSLYVQEIMQRLVETAQPVVLSSTHTPNISIIDAMAASCAFFSGFRIGKEKLYDGFYYSNLPTRIIMRGRRRAHILAHQTDPFIGNTWTNWLLHRLFNQETIMILRQRFYQDESLARSHGVLLCPRVQELSSPFNAAVMPLIKAGRIALAESQDRVDRLLLGCFDGKVT
jgi:hypothetical protein